jgi:nitrate reductase gamma subunit
MHVSIYWGFTALFFQTVLMSSLQYLIPAASPIAVFFLQDWGLQLLDIWGDFWGLVMLFGLAIALIRRYVVISEQLHTLAEDAVVLWLLLGVVLTGFLAEGVRISLEGQAIGTDYSFIGIMVAKLNSSLLGIENKMVMFWVHGVISLALIAYLPFSKLVHVFTAPGEIILSSREEGSEKESLTGGRGEYLDGVSQTAGLE